MKSINEYIYLSIKTAILSILAFISPISGLLLMVGTFVISDTILAIYATIKINGYTSFRSHKLFNLVVKTFFYLGSIFLAYLIDKFVVQSNTIFGIDLLISKIIAILWAYIEVKSMDETSQKLGNRPIIFVIKEIINKAKDIKNDINEITE